MTFTNADIRQAAALMDDDDRDVLEDRAKLLQQVCDLEEQVGETTEDDLNALRERVRLLREIRELEVGDDH
jgi:hypothetical protein